MKTRVFKAKIFNLIMSFIYSNIIEDRSYQYRQVTTNKDIANLVQEKGLLSEIEWRELGINMSRGWMHYTVYVLEPTILLFRRLKNSREPAESNCH